jgi:ABC-type Fe3+-hydroxamate transport system substrate-binding protein
MHTPFPIEALPERVVSLVPSITETMYDLGFGKWMVGCTDYCVYPSAETSKLAKVGGPKKVNTDLIIQLAPALVLANQEENCLEDIVVLEQHGIPVWGAFPLSVRDAMDDLWGMVGLFQSDQAARIVRSFEDSLGWLLASTEEQMKLSYFCPIWKDKDAEGQTNWMTFNNETYMSDLLGLFGGSNVFGSYQLKNTHDEKKRRYPVVTDDQIIQAKPDLIILPDEPFLFTEADRQSLMDIYRTAQAGCPRIKMVQGATIMWHGTRLAKAFDSLPELFQL